MVRTGLLIVFYRKKCSHHFGRGKSPLRSGLASLSTQKLPSAISGTNSSFGRGKTPPAPHLKNRLPPQRDGSVFFPPPSLHSAGARFPCPQRPIYGVFVFFRKAENVSLREQTKTRRASGSLRHARNAHQRASCGLRHGPWKCHIKKSRISKFLLTETEFGDIIFTCRHNRKAAQLFDSEGTEGRQKRRWARQENRISFWPTGQEYT